jgi:hypothetical protein
MQQSGGRSETCSLAPMLPHPSAIVQAWALERARKMRAERAMRVELKLTLTARDFSKSRSAAVLLQIERWCLKPCRARRLYKGDSRYTLTLDTKAGQSIDVSARTLLGRLRTIAEERDCDLDAVIRHRSTGRVFWI